MVVVVVVFIARDIVSNMDIPFDLLDTDGEKKLPSRVSSGGQLK